MTIIVKIMSVIVMIHMKKLHYCIDGGCSGGYSEQPYL